MSEEPSAPSSPTSPSWTLPPPQMATPVATPHRLCVVCNEQSRLRCSQCKRAFYCNTTCQEQDWPAHSEICEHLSASFGSMLMCKHSVADVMQESVFLGGVRSSVSRAAARTSGRRAADAGCRRRAPTRSSRSTRTGTARASSAPSRAAAPRWARRTSSGRASRAAIESPLAADG